MMRVAMRGVPWDDGEFELWVTACQGWDVTSGAGKETPMGREMQTSQRMVIAMFDRAR